MRILFVVNDFGYFLSHRMQVGVAARSLGYDVHVAAPGEPPAAIVNAGIIPHTIQLQRGGVNIISELSSLLRLIGLFRKLRPHLVHLVTVKPVLYGGIAARLTGVPAVVSAVAGLGTVFTADSKFSSLMRKVAAIAYRVALGHSNQRVIFQNPSDDKIVSRLANLSSQKTRLIRGSGVSLSEYTYESEHDSTPVVVFAGRLLRQKGVLEFVDAARILTARKINSEFWLVGEPDPGNPYSVTSDEIRQWSSESVVKILGFRSDIPSLYATANIVTLPSYYGEGLPKSLIEAAACGRAVVTTDHPGCRDAIEPDISGLLVPVRDSRALADAIEQLINDRELRLRMGKAGRALAEREFAIDKVVEAHLAVYDELIRKSEIENKKS